MVKAQGSPVSRYVHCPSAWVVPGVAYPLPSQQPHARANQTHESVLQLLLLPLSFTTPQLNLGKERKIRYIPEGGKGEAGLVCADSHAQKYSKYKI